MTRPARQGPSGRPAGCLVCGRPCERHERNTDGSYAHDACLRSRQTIGSARRLPEAEPDEVSWSVPAELPARRELLPGRLEPAVPAGEPDVDWDDDDEAPDVAQGGEAA